MRSTQLSFALPAVLLCAAARRALADDIILLKGEPRTGVTVTDETYEGVIYRQKGIPQPQSYPAAKVREVRYERKSTPYRLAEDAFGARDFSKAVELFKTAAANAKNWEKQYALFLAAECLRAQGRAKLDEAIKAYRDLLEQVPKTKFFGDCYERIAMCQRAQGKLEDAKQTYEQLKGQVTLKNLSPRWDLLADFRLLELSEKANPDAALNGYEELQQKAAEYPDVANMARLRVGYVMIQKGQIERARKFFDDIIKDRQASDVLTVAGAYNGLGTTYVAGKKEPTSDDFRSALYPFFRTIFHYGDELGPNELVAEALYWGGRCLEARGKENDVKRAKVLYDRCTKEYPTSEWAKLAAHRK
jgi:TolA-binding protein